MIRYRGSNQRGEKKIVPAYNEIYLKDAMANLADCFDYAVNDCEIPLDIFIKLFVATGLAVQFGTANPKYIAGMSGVELAEEVCQKSGYMNTVPKMKVRTNKTAEYWCGWVMAYYQWVIGRTFAEIMKHVTAEEIIAMYPTLHEASEDKFVDTMEIIIQRRTKNERKLKQLRRIQGYSQKLLAEKSGVSLRAIQQYEQGQKDIHKAQAGTVKKLADALGVSMEELLSESPHCSSPA